MAGGHDFPDKAHLEIALEKLQRSYFHRTRYRFGEISQLQLLAAWPMIRYLQNWWAALPSRPPSR
jgi:hypothetical protein